MLDLFDTAFVVFTGPNGDPWRDAAAEIGRQDCIPLQAYRVGTGAAADLADPAGAFLELYGIDARGAVLVRPDGFVAWRQPSLPPRPAEMLRAALDHILTRT
jgi:hypothetical protein